MHRSKRKRNIIIFSLIGILLCMVVGYAAFQTRLEIKGTSKVTSNWDIEITNVTAGTPTGSAENATKPSWKATSASMEANLYDKSDAMEYDVTIENKGTIDAKLNDILTNLEQENSDAVIITFSGYTKGEVLKAKESKIVHVKIAYNPDYDGEETSSEVTIDFEYTQDNKSEDAPTTYLLTYDYSTNGGDRVDSEGEYLTGGSNVDLSNVAYKQGWRFVGWNTDKNAEVGLTSYQMKEEATTLYAIYSKDLKAIYEKGENIQSIGKEEDTCTIYNNETSCEITLPSITPSEGYAVDGWYNGNDKIGDPNDKYALTNNITLTSKVTQNTYTVTYDYETNGGTSATKETDKVNYGENIDLTPTATKSGWTFVGWNTNKNATSALSSLTMGDSNVTLYAIYRKEAKTITITFNKNGSTSQTPSGGSVNGANTLTQSCTIAAVYNNATQASSCNITSPTINASTNTPTVVGYNTSASATSSSWNQNTSKAVSANATYYAITRKDAVTLTAKFNANGASLSSSSNQTCTLAATYNGTAQATSCTVTAPTITRSGYTIIGYNTSASSTTNNSSYNTSNKALTLKTSNNNSTWYAITSKVVTATFNANGATSIGSTSQSCTMYNTNDSCSITTPSITRSGFTITGWGTSASATSAAVKANASVSLTANITYYAVTSKVVTVTYSRGSNVSSIGSTSGTCTIQNSVTNCQVTLPTITASSTYIADGWYSGSTKVGDAGDKYTVSNNTTLTAQAVEDNITLSISATNTTNSITVVANATADSGIAKYEFSKDGGSSWVNGGTNKTYTFSGLTQGTAYNIQVRVTANSGKTTSTSKSVTTSSIAKPTFSETNEGEVVIAYPSGCTNGKTCSYVQNNGSSNTVNGTTTVNVGEDGTIVATVTDGVNTVSSTYTVIRRNLYVSTSGSDTTGYGTIAKPYKTVDKAYEAATSTSQATIYLMNNISQPSALNMDNNKDIILTSYDGVHSFIKENSNTAQILIITNGALTLEDVTIDGNNIATPTTALIDCYSVLNIEDGTTIKNANNVYDNGATGAVYGESSNAIITMNGGTITNNRGVPAAVGVTASATFIMNGGVITTNNTNTGGHWGSVFFTTGANFEVHGGTIVNNESNIGDGAKIDNIVEEQMQNVITKDYTISPTFIHNSNKYRIISALNNTSAMSIEAGGTCNPISENCNVWLYGNNNASPSQDWGIGLESVVDGKTYYKFYNIGYSNKCLDVDSNGTSDSTNVRSYTCNSSDGQRFYLEPAGNDYYYIKHKTSNKCVDIVGGATTDGTNIQIYTCNNSNAQKWKFVEAN